MPDCDVLIIGAGPVGTALALELALHQVSFRVIDKASARSDKSKALIVQPRTLELFNRHGVAHELCRRGNRMNGNLLHIDRKPIASIDLGGAAPAEAEFPLPLMLSQAETEKFLDECLAKHDASVERPVIAKSIVQDESGVTTELEGPDGKEEVVRSKYVVGCDGAHSIVRHSAGNLTFDGAAYPQDFALCDTYLRDSNIPQDRMSIYLGQGLMGVIPLGDGLVRIFCSAGVLNSAEDNGQINQQIEVKLDHFQKAMERFMNPGHGTLYNPVWLSRFRLHRRIVNNYRDGRLFVAGDAAHIHSPAGGQGMNTGVHDSFNLGWKLAAVLHGQTPNPEALLDSYNAERHPVGQQVLNGTDRLFSFTASTNPWFLWARNLILPWVLPWFWGNEERAKTAYQFISELGVNYRGSPIVGTADGFTGPVVGGDRLPDGELMKLSRLSNSEEKASTRVHHICTGPSHHLIFFAGGGDRDHHFAKIWESNVAEFTRKIERMGKKTDIKFHVIGKPGLSEFKGSLVDSSYLDVDGVVHERYGFPRGPGYVLARPDGYIAHIGALSSVYELLGYIHAKTQPIFSSLITIMSERRPENVDQIQHPLDNVDATPLVLFHDGSGTVFSYHMLGDLSRPMWAVSNPHYGKDTKFLLGMPEMARRYVSNMKKCIPSGKIILGGWSQGGLTSLEVSRILAEDNYYTVVGIVMIDSVCPMVYGQAHLDALKKIVPHVVEWGPTTREDTKKAVLKCFDEATEMAKKWTLPSWGDRVLPPPVILLKAKDPVPVVEAGGIGRPDVVRHDPKLGWELYREDFITKTEDISGHHYSVFATQWRQEALTVKIKNACKDLERMYVAKR
ncbi:hypothetical protein V8F20_011345 [Naviculisporaceae sp. PSN 640]